MATVEIYSPLDKCLPDMRPQFTGHPTPDICAPSCISNSYRDVYLLVEQGLLMPN